MRAVPGVIIGILLCLSGPALGSQIDISTHWAWAYPVSCLLTNFFGGIVLARYAGAGAFVVAGIIAVVQALFSVALIGSAAIYGRSGNAAIISVAWLATLFAAIFICRWRARARP